eukprot:5210709-Amphidinium_carterae.1
MPHQTLCPVNSACVSWQFISHHVRSCGTDRHNVGTMQNGQGAHRAWCLAAPHARSCAGQGLEGSGLNTVSVAPISRLGGGLQRSF